MIENLLNEIKLDTLNPSVYFYKTLKNKNILANKNYFMF